MIKTYACSKFYKNDQLKHSMNPSILQITTNIQFKSNHPTYLFDFLRIMIDIQLKLNDSIYMSDETHLLMHSFQLVTWHARWTPSLNDPSVNTCTVRKTIGSKRDQG
jgi:hypothetical protein